MYITKKIKEERLKRDLRQLDVAEYLDISLPHYSSIERGARKLGLDRAEKLAKLYNRTIEDLCFSNDEY